MEMVVDRKKSSTPWIFAFLLNTVANVLPGFGVFIVDPKFLSSPEAVPFLVIYMGATSLFSVVCLVMWAKIDGWWRPALKRVLWWIKVLFAIGLIFNFVSMFYPLSPYRQEDQITTIHNFFGLLGAELFFLNFLDVQELKRLGWYSLPAFVGIALILYQLNFHNTWYDSYYVRDDTLPWLIVGDILIGVSVWIKKTP